MGNGVGIDIVSPDNGREREKEREMGENDRKTGKIGPENYELYEWESTIIVIVFHSDYADDYPFQGYEKGEEAYSPLHIPHHPATINSARINLMANKRFACGRMDTFLVLAADKGRPSSFPSIFEITGHYPTPSSLYHRPSPTFTGPHSKDNDFWCFITQKKRKKGKTPSSHRWDYKLKITLAIGGKSIHGWNGVG